MRWRASTAFLLGACIVLVLVVLVQYHQLHPTPPGPKIVTVVTTNQPMIQRPPHRPMPTANTQPRIIRVDGANPSDTTVPPTTRVANISATTSSKKSPASAGPSQLTANEVGIEPVAVSV